MVDWLPDLVEYDRDWDAYSEKLYSAYMSTYRNGRSLHYNGKPVIAPAQPEFNGKSESFWHIIGGQDNTPERDRCERIRWARAIIEHCNYPEVITLKECRGRRNNTLLWLKSAKYLVVLEERKKYYILRTAYPATKPHKIQQLEAAYRNQQG